MKLKKTRNAAFTLVEVTLALGVAAFCLLAIFGLLPVGLRSNQSAIEQTAANGIISAVAADLRAAPPSTSGTTTAQFLIPIPMNPVQSTTTDTLYFASDGQCSGSTLNGPALSSTTTSTISTHKLVVTFLPTVPSTNTRAATQVSLKVTWPAGSSGIPSGSVSAFVALDRN